MTCAPARGSNGSWSTTGASPACGCSDGEELLAPVVVSNADIKRTYLDMVGREHLSARTVRRVDGWRMTLPFVNVYLGLDIDLADRMPNTNLFSMPTWDSLDLLWTDTVQGIGSRDAGRLAGGAARPARRLRALLDRQGPRRPLRARRATPRSR